VQGLHRSLFCIFVFLYKFLQIFDVGMNFWHLNEFENDLKMKNWLSGRIRPADRSLLGCAAR
jgi:hypothetical protein